MIFVFFKQKTAYEMRISDWSSDVCSSDLICRCSAAFPCRRSGISGATVSSRSAARAGADRRHRTVCKPADAWRHILLQVPSKPFGGIACFADRPQYPQKYPQIKSPWVVAAGRNRTLVAAMGTKKYLIWL